ncbi:MAG: PepSY domain-containing protein, partial [bacterium]
MMKKIGISLAILIFYSIGSGFLPDQNERRARWITPPEYTLYPNEKTGKSFEMFKQKYGCWQASFDRFTGLPHNAFGHGIHLETSDIIGAIREFMRKNEYIFPHQNELVLRSFKRRGGTFYITFDEYYKGIPILNGKADFRVKNGKLVFFSSDLNPQVSCPTVPVIPVEKAIEIASTEFQFDTHKTELVIVRSGKRYDLVWNIKCKSSKTSSRYSIFVDAITGEILYWYSENPTLIYGDIKGLIHPHYGTESLVYQPFPYEYVTTDTSFADTTDEFGRFSFSAEPGTRFLVITELKGLYADIKPVGESRALILHFFPEGEEIRLLWNDSTGTRTQINPYYHINIVHDYFKQLDTYLTEIDYEMPIIVNDTTYPTPENAFWDNRGVHLGRGGRTFDNFALYADVIYHEYTHGVTEFTYPRPMPY